MSYAEMKTLLVCLLIVAYGVIYGVIIVALIAYGIWSCL